MRERLFQLIQNRQFIIFVIFSVTPITIIKYLSKMYICYWKAYISVYPEKSIFTDILFGLIFLLICFYYGMKLKKGVSINTSRTYLFTVVVFWYVIARFILKWEFSRVHQLESICYADIILFVLYINYIFITKDFSNELLRSYFSDSKCEKSNNSEGFIPESLNSDDLLGRKKYAERIASAIMNTDIKGQSSCAIGINGRWGTGKSFFMNIIKNYLPERDSITIDFNPWKNHETKNLTSNFFNVISDSLSKFDPNLSPQFSQYSKKLSNMDDIYAKAVDFIYGLIYTEKSTDELFEEINKTIRKIDKKIIVFIDDLDRVDEAEVLEMMKLIRISSNFENTIFVVAYDKEYILEKLNSNDNSTNRNYLEKIFIVDFNLPDFEPNRLYKELQNKLIEVINNEYNQYIYDYFDGQTHYQERILIRCITNIRDLVRFQNIFKINFSQVEGHVNFYDFLNLELIRYKFPDIYNFIRDNITKIRQVENQSQVFFTINKEEATKIWDSNKKMSKYDLDLVYCLFEPQKRLDSEIPYVAYKGLNEMTSLSIRCFQNTLTYFTLRLTDETISAIDFQKLKNSDTETFVETLEAWSQQSQHTNESLRTKLEAVSDFKNEQEFFNILLGIYLQISASHSRYGFNSNKRMLESYFDKLNIYGIQNIDFNIIQRLLRPPFRYSQRVSIEIASFILSYPWMYIDMNDKQKKTINRFQNDVTEVYTDILQEEVFKILRHPEEGILKNLSLLCNYFKNGISEELKKKSLNMIKDCIFEQRTVFLSSILKYDLDSNEVILSSGKLYEIFSSKNEVRELFDTFSKPLSTELENLFNTPISASESSVKNIFSEVAINQLIQEIKPLVRN